MALYYKFACDYYYYYYYFILKKIKMLTYTIFKLATDKDNSY